MSSNCMAASRRLFCSIALGTQQRVVAVIAVEKDQWRW
jgi:hypothetical protein